MPTPSITPTPKLDATETYLTEQELKRPARGTATAETRADIAKSRRIAREAHSQGWDDGMAHAAEQVRALIAEAEHRANVVGLPVVWSVALEQLAADLDAGVKA